MTLQNAEGRFFIRGIDKAIEEADRKALAPMLEKIGCGSQNLIFVNVT